MAALLLLTLALAPADAPAPPDGPPPPDAVRVEDAGELQGTWEIVKLTTGKTNRTAEYKAFLWEFDGASARLVSRSGSVCRRLIVRVDATRCTSEAVDLNAEDGHNQRGVYRRTGDVLLWAVDATGEGRRPTGFDPSPEVRLWTLRRVKK